MPQLRIFSRSNSPTEGMDGGGSDTDALIPRPPSSRGMRSYLVDHLFAPLIPRTNAHAKKGHGGNANARAEWRVAGTTSPYAQAQDAPYRDISKARRDAPLPPLPPRKRTISLAARPFHSSSQPSLSHSTNSTSSSRSSSTLSTPHSETPPASVNNPWAVSARTVTIRKERDYTTTCTIIQPIAARSDAPNGESPVSVSEMLSSLPLPHSSGDAGNGRSRLAGIGMKAKSDRARNEKKRPALADIQTGWGGVGDPQADMDVDERLVDGFPESRRSRYEREFAIETDTEGEGHGRVARKACAAGGRLGVNITVTTEREVITDEDYRRMRRRERFHKLFTEKRDWYDYSY